jgi:peroxiredoxin
LADFQSQIAEFDARGIAVLAASADKLTDALTTVSRQQLAFPAVYGLDAEKVAGATGAFYDREKGYLHATGFTLAPDGTVAAAVYSTGPLGRYTASDVIRWISPQLE